MQIQPVGWRGGSGGAAVFGLEHWCHFARGTARQADLDECADDDAHHLPEKAGALDRDDEARAVASDVDACDRAHGVFPAMAGLGKAGEVVRAHEQRGGGADGGVVEGLPTVPGQIGLEHRAIWLVPDDVFVALGGGHRNGVKRVIYLLDGPDKDIARQARVDGLAQVFRWDLDCGGIEVSNLRVGMHAGVGPAGATDRDGMANNGANRPLKCLLYGGDAGGALGKVALPGRGRRLDLPPVVRGSAVGYDDFEAARRRNKAECSFFF